MSACSADAKTARRRDRWYQYFDEVTGADTDENLAAILEHEVPVDVVQRDDGYQAGIGDWLEVPDRFRSLAGMVERIRGGGLRAGIWIARPYQRGRYWVNDPDCLLLRPGIEHRQRRVDLVARHGGLRGASDRITALDDWGLNKTRELLGAVPAPTSFADP